MRVGASRPRQTSQGEDKDRNINSEDTTADNVTASGKERSSGNNEEDDNDDQGSGLV